MNSTPLEKAIAVSGSAYRLAKEVGVRPPTVISWLRSKRRLIPASRVLSVEKVTGISRHELRPDIYPLENEAT